MRSTFPVLCLWVCIWIAFAESVSDFNQHYINAYRSGVGPWTVNKVEEETNYWMEKAQKTLKDQTNKKLNTNVAKNVIMFLGDGMSIPTLAATRIYKWQKEQSKMGEGEFLSFESFPHVGLARTYCVDTQVADSACSATAYLGGVKGNIGTIGVNGKVTLKNCSSMAKPENHVEAIAMLAQKSGKSAGVVTTTRVTHATPAGSYAHTANRDWESDADIVQDRVDPKKCHDIAHQLIYDLPGKDFKVIMGGGRKNFLPRGYDPVFGDGVRLDRENLIETWEKNVKEKGSYKIVKDRKGLQSITSTPDYLLGLFTKSHFKYHLQSDDSQPTLEEMTSAAIKVLQKNEKGYFLLVEGGHIDMGHHDTKAQIAFDETIEFSKAVHRAVSMTNESDTLIVVTADHAHTMSMSGYASRSQSILGHAGIASDRKPYSIISYANGEGFRIVKGERPDLSKDNIDDPNYTFPSAAPLASETHGGDDVAVFARGPYSHLFTGSFEQNYIPHAMAYAACLGNGLKACDKLF